jgi:PAS domain S-box-containing protein
LLSRVGNRLDVNRKELLTILDALSESHRGMTIIEISKAIGMNRHSVAKYLEVLVAAGHVDMRSFGPSKIFSVSQRVPISAMLSFSSDMIVTLDKDLRVRFVNDKLLEFTGLGREQVLRKNIEKFAHSIQTVPPLLPYIRSALEGNEASVDVFYRAGTNGYYFIVKALPTIFEDGEQGATMIMSDITARVEAREALRKERGELEIRVKERTAELEEEIAKRISYENALKESEEKYRSLVENINDMVWEVDESGKFTYVSSGVRDMLGYEPSEVIGMTIEGSLSPPDKEHVLDDTRHLLSKPQSYVMRDARIIHKDGHEVIIEANGTPVFDVNGNFKGYRGVTRDITARRRAEEALRKSEEQYRNLVENVGEWIWENDQTGLFTYSSPKVYDLLGYRPEEIIGIRPFDLMTPENARKMLDKVTAIAEKGVYPPVLEAELLHKDGNTVFLEVSGKAVYDQQGDAAGFRGVARDITARKQAEEALRLAEEKYRNLVENINDVAWEIDTEGRFIYISPKIRDMMGYDPSEFIGRTIVAFLAPAHEKKIIDNLERVFTEPEPYSLQETHVLHKDGHEIIVEANAIVVYDGQGRFKGYRGIIRDITARKRTEEALRLAEEKLRNTIENVNDIVWEMGPDARFTYVSPKARDILGHGPEHYTGHVITEFMPPEDVPRFMEGFRRIFANPRPYSLEHMRMYHKDGSILSVEVNGSPFYDEKGQFLGFQGVTRDITKRKDLS